MNQPSTTSLRALFDAADAKRGPMHLIARDFSGVDLYVGNRQAASDPALLVKHGVNAVLNCALNLDINLVKSPATDSRNQDFGRADLRYYKLGLIDGAGNPAEMLLAGYLQLCGLMRQQMPNKATYPWPNGGHVLVNCRGGRSRSVVLVSLFLHLQRPASFPTLDTAIAHVRDMRQLDPVEWPSAPKPVLIEAAQWAASAAKLLQGHAFLQGAPAP
jgi:myo-inositol-1(or 4)-monophosphatase